MEKIANLKISDNDKEGYTFEVYPKETDFPAVAGVYMFTERDSDRKHTILYIGETDSFKDRTAGERTSGTTTSYGIMKNCFRILVRTTSMMLRA